MTILVTGGAGFIGSHTVLALIEAGYNVVIIDNLSNASEKVIARLNQLTHTKIPFIKADIRDKEALQTIFNQYDISSVIHFAGLKAVGESVKEPLKYYDNNVNGSLVLLEEMQKAGIHNIVFSSSATVYGTPATTPITETMPTGQTTNPYGTSKYMVERILMDLQTSQPQWSIVLLRYFNPIGAHHSGLIGEDPNGIPNNLIPYISQVAIGKLPYLAVFGADYPTQDGTGVRDYIHVMDLADGHIKALQKHANDSALHIYNLGTGIGYSVLEMVTAFEKVSGKKINYKITPRREGDIAICYADNKLAKLNLGWEARYNLNQMIADSWRWQSQNPNGYQD